MSKKVENSKFCRVGGGIRRVCQMSRWRLGKLKPQEKSS